MVIFGWNASAEADWSFGRAGLALKAGDKSSGYYPGTPAGDGAYAQLGAMVMW